MKKSLIIIFIIVSNICFSQTHSRKTRSDKGKKHSHSTSYYVKKNLKPATTVAKKKK